MMSDEKRVAMGLPPIDNRRKGPTAWDGPEQLWTAEVTVGLLGVPGVKLTWHGSPWMAPWRAREMAQALLDAADAAEAATTNTPQH